MAFNPKVFMCVFVYIYTCVCVCLLKFPPQSSKVTGNVQEQMFALICGATGVCMEVWVQVFAWRRGRAGVGMGV